MAQNVDLEFRASGSLFRDLEVMQAQVSGLGEAHKKVHEGIQEDLAQSAGETKKFGASVSAASQLVVALAKSAGQGLPALAKSLAEVADLTEQARAGLSSTDRTNLSNVNSALRGIADTQGLVVRQVNAEKKARIDALVEAKKITKEEANLLEETTAVVDTLKEAAVASTELAVSLDGPIEQGATLAQQYRSITLSGALSILDSVSGNLCRTNMTLDDMLKAVGYAMQVAGAEPEGLQMPADGTMQPIEYAGMSTRQVDFEACRQILAEFLDNSFVVADP